MAELRAITEEDKMIGYVIRKLYESKGFSATGVEDEDELELVTTVTTRR